MTMNDSKLTHKTSYSCKYKSHDIDALKTFGFWIYLMSDGILFSCLFATYIVLINGTADGPTGKDIFNLPFVLVETILLLFSSTTYSILTIISTYKNNKSTIVFWMIITFIIGISFLIIESYKLHYLIIENFGPNRSGFLSAFFALICIHSLHIAFGLIWMIVLMLQIISKGLNKINYTRLKCLGLFWHFLYIIWICIFSFVYLKGVIEL